MAEPSWGIVATVAEPPQLVLAFVAYHLALGAAEIHLFLDQPNPEAEKVLATLPGVHLTLCDAAYWADGLGRRPPRHTGRQAYNADQAYRRAGVDWLLHCDADEFLCDIERLRHRMAAARPDIAYLQLGVLERVHLEGEHEPSIFGGVFRQYGGHFDDWGGDVYGRFAKFLQNGLSGHSAGKALVRTGRGDIRMDIHFPRMRGGDAVTPFERLPGQLLHFDGLTPLHLVLKLVRRLYLPKIEGNRNPHGINRGAQMRFANNNKTSQREMERLVQGIQVLSPGQVAQLDDRALLVHRRFDPTPELTRMGIAPDLSRAAFDDDLRIREAALIEEAELSF